MYRLDCSGMIEPHVYCVIFERETHFRSTRVHTAQATHVHALKFSTKVTNTIIHSPMLLWHHFEMQLACDWSENDNNE